jgi:hypothetical protein
MVMILGTFFIPFLSFVIPSKFYLALIFRKVNKNDLYKSGLMILCLVCCVISLAGVWNLFESSDLLTEYLDKNMTEEA